MSRVFFNSETARLAGKRSGEARRTHKANGTNAVTRIPLGSVAEQEQTDQELATTALRLDVKALRALERRIDSGKATVTELLAYCDWRKIRPPRRQEVPGGANGVLAEAIRTLLKGESEDKAELS